MGMKPKDKKRVDRFRKADPRACRGKSDRQVLEIIKGMGKDRAEFQRNFARLMKTY